MNQKATVVLIVILLIAGLAGVIVAGATGKSPTASPTPSPSDLIFNSQKGDQNALAQQQQQLAQQQQQQQMKPKKQYAAFPGSLAPSELANKKAVIQTDKGNIEFEIYPDATKAASNFIFLARDQFYDGLTFHRVEPGFVIQGGDPNGNGTGGPGYTFEDEPVTRQYTTGTVAMANSGPNTNGSQFFIMLADHPDLPAKYTIFGKVIAGQDVVNQIKVGDVMQKVTIENNTPKPAGP